MPNLSSFLIAAAKRREKGITLDQISKLTKIGIRSLQAIEEGDFRKLPGGIYNTSYIRQYARAIDADEYELIARYQEWAGLAAAPAPARKQSVDRFMPLMQE